MASRANWTCSGRRGFTLLEAVITLLLVSVVFGVAADLLSSACRVMAQSNAKNNTTQAIQMALARMTSEAREAFTVESTGSDLTLLKVDPSANRFPTTAPGTWDPYQFKLRVRYYADAGRLWRDVTPLSAGGPTVTQMVADGITGLFTQPLAGGGIELNLSLLDDRVVRSLTTQVRTPAVLPP